MVFSTVSRMFNQVTLDHGDIELYQYKKQCTAPLPPSQLSVFLDLRYPALPLYSQGAVPRGSMRIAIASYDCNSKLRLQ